MNTSNVIRLPELYNDFWTAIPVRLNFDKISDVNKKKITIPETRITVPVTEPIPVM
jgi:hypothetical protein